MPRRRRPSRAASTSSRRAAVGPLAWPRFAAYLASGRGHERARDLLTAHDADRFVIRCDVPTPLQVDGEDLGTSSVELEAERDAVTVLV